MVANQYTIFKNLRGGFGKYHKEYFDNLKHDLIKKRKRIELNYRKRPDEYLKYCDVGFSTGIALRDRTGKLVLIEGKRSMPDLVDFKEDRIYDLKTTVKSLVVAPSKNKNEGCVRLSAEEVVKIMVHKNRKQIRRYILAYWKARRRPPTVLLYIKGYDRIIGCGWYPTLKEWFIVEDEIRWELINDFIND